MVWAGAWVAGVEGECPSNTDFNESENVFSLSSPFEKNVESKLNAEQFHGLTPAWNGEYKLDNGEGLGTYSDLEHVSQFVFPSDTEDKAACQELLCVAKGNTEFGKFMSHGVLSFTDEGEVQLTLARRYIGDKDPRVKWKLDDIAGHIDDTHRQAPWNQLPCKLARKKASKRKRQ